MRECTVSVPPEHVSEKTPMAQANILSRITWNWMTSIVNAGYEKSLEMTDLPLLGKVDSAKYLFDQAIEHWSGGARRVFKITPLLKKGFLKIFLLNGLMELTYMALQIASWLLLKELILFLSGGQTNLGIAYLSASLLGISGILQAFVHHGYFFGANRIGAQVRTLMNTVIFDKLLRLKQSALIETTTGQIVNLVTNDSFKMEMAATYTFFLIAGPIVGIVVMILLYQELGVASFAACATTFAMVPLQSFFSGRFASIRKKTMEFTDQRVKIIKEILVGSQIVKMYNWETPLLDRVSQYRESEIKNLGKAAVMKAWNQGLFFVSLTLVCIVGFSTFVALGNTLDPATIFSSVFLFSVLHFPITGFFPMSVEGLSESSIAISRIERFLSLQEIEAVERKDEESSTKEPTIHMQNCDFAWNLKSDIVLKNISMLIPKNSLTVIIGKIGSSKSSLLMAILGEMTLMKGTLRIDGLKSFASQKPWIFAGSVKENIVFYRTFDKERYEKVVKSCELEKDIELLPQGDETIIGERGVNLSGGQKARVSLARACYAISDFYLFDDPLSAVDAVVGSRIMQNCIQAGFLEGSTRILVTHQTQFISAADHLIFMDNGNISFQGHPKDFIANEQEFIPNLSSSPIAANHVYIEPSDIIAESPKPMLLKIEDTKRNSKSESGIGIIENEDRQIGKVGLNVYTKLFSSVGSSLVVSTFFFTALAAQVSQVFSDYWLSKWSSASISEQKDKSFVIVYIILGMVSLFLSVSRTQIFFRMMLRASARLHNGMFEGVLYSPMRFFEANPVGRILNRFTKDQATVDENLPLSLWDVVQLSLMVASVLLVVGILNPIALVSLVVIIPVFFFTRSRYVNSSREIKRLEGITKSPVLAFFSSTLDGLTTLRAFNMQSHFMNAFMKKLDYNNRAWYSYLYLSRWIGFRLDFVSSLMVLTATLGAVGVKSTSNSGLIAFALFYVLRLTSLFQWAVRQSAEAENFMTSLERIYTYSTLPDEGIRIQNSNRPSKDWPSRGEIKVIDLKLRYRSDLDLVLNGLNLNILPSEKIGVCGRTGAGKSSLFSAFFRLVNAESGSIEIDGIDISTIGLDDLRAKLSIIPQDPVIFSGTIRYNLDPFSLYSDDAIWDALEAVQMKSVVEKLPEGLQTKIAEYGGNFSVGEGQLICVARAILKPSKILFVDEATANVDKRTDELIQNVLRTKFKDRTLITIAHRLNTIIDYDRIVVMNEGKVAEFGKPLELLSIPNGIFKSMASESGIHGI